MAKTTIFSADSHQTSYRSVMGRCIFLYMYFFQPTAPDIPRWSPIQVLTRPSPAQPPRSDEIGRVQGDVAVGQFVHVFTFFFFTFNMPELVYKHITLFEIRFLLIYYYMQHLILLTPNTTTISSMAIKYFFLFFYL